MSFTIVRFKYNLLAFFIFLPLEYSRRLITNLLFNCESSKHFNSVVHSFPSVAIFRVREPNNNPIRWFLIRSKNTWFIPSVQFCSENGSHTMATFVRFYKILDSYYEVSYRFSLLFFLGTEVFLKLYLDFTHFFLHFGL